MRAKLISATNPAHISFFVPNLFTSGPKNILIIVVVIKRKVSLREKALRLILSASVIAVRYKVLPLEQKPSDTQTDIKQSAIITHV